MPRGELGVSELLATFWICRLEFGQFGRAPTQNSSRWARLAKAIVLPRTNLLIHQSSGFTRNRTVTAIAVLTAFRKRAFSRLGASESGRLQLAKVPWAKEGGKLGVLDVDRLANAILQPGAVSGTALCARGENCKSRNPCGVAPILRGVVHSRSPVCRPKRQWEGVAVVHQVGFGPEHGFDNIGFDRFYCNASNELDKNALFVQRICHM